MKQKVPVSVIMTKNIVKLNLTDDLSKAEVLFKNNKIRHIPVVNHCEIVGILSLTDLMRVSCPESIDDAENEGVESLVYNMFTIAQVMSKEVVTVKPYTTIKEVATLLAEKEFHALPVCDGSNLVGIVTTTDLIKYLLSQYDAED
ncbi:CBS domain-containing protein [Flavobacterium sp. NG2]|uniref:CBS domain-containing protein n=1 Tax=Flavobacterium sp. NG2 TaxID=3097547 RepID=UPI002A839BF7|nr:CBS domain-containing protein [Flavobacterium sp. NG2]WPR72719.1 CBS domain-containing protein [Flavobacterium sp. NG2]